MPRSPSNRGMRRVLLTLLVASLAACAGPRRSAEGDAAFARADYEEAWNTYAETLAANPEDDLLRARVDAARRAALLDRGRRSLLAGSERAALAVFESLHEEDPADAIAARWLEKTREAIAASLVAAGKTAVSEERFEEARDAYEAALAVRPGDEGANRKLGELEAILARRTEQATEFYLGGMHALGADRLFEAKGGFSNTLRFDPGHSRAQLREVEVSHRLVDERIRQAGNLAAAGRYAAAHREAALAADLLPEAPRALALREEYAIEAEVQDLLRRADQRMVRGELEEARTLLEEARGRTKQEGERIDRLLRALAERELERVYLSALELEADRRFEEAVAAYRKLLDRTPYYRDAIARLDQLEALLEHLGSLYARAAEADRGGDSAGALRLLDEITAFYPEYRDVAERRIRSRAEPEARP